MESALQQSTDRGVFVAGQRMMSPSSKYDVTLHPIAMLLGVMSGLAGAIVCIKKFQDPRGLIINRVIELDSSGADVFWSALIVASLGLAVAAAVLFIQSLGERVYIVLDSQAISGPSSEYGIRTVRIEYCAIQGVTVSSIREWETLRITATDGRKIKIGQWRFRVSAQWNDFKQELRSKLEVR